MKREWMEQEKWWLGRGDESGGRDKRKIKGRGWVEWEGWNGKRERKRKGKQFLIEEQIRW